MNLEPFKQLTIKTSTFLSVAVGLIADLLTPLQTPYGFYIAFFIFILFLISAVLASIPVTNSYIKDKYHVYWYLPFGLFLLVTSMLLFGFYLFSSQYSNDNKGFLASNVGEFSDLQHSLGVIQNNTAEIVKNTGGILDVNKEILDTNIGASNPIDNLFHALLRGDIDTIEYMSKKGQDITIIKRNVEIYGDAVLLSAVKNNRTTIISVIEFLINKNIIEINDLYPTNPHRPQLLVILQAYREKKANDSYTKNNKYESRKKIYLDKKKAYGDRVNKLRSLAATQAYELRNKKRKKYKQAMKQYFGGGGAIEPNNPVYNEQANAIEIFNQLIANEGIAEPIKPKREEIEYSSNLSKHVSSAKITLLQEARLSQNLKLEKWLLSNGADTQIKGYIKFSDNSKLTID